MGRLGSARGGEGHTDASGRRRGVGVCLLVNRLSWGEPCPAAVPWTSEGGEGPCGAEEVK